MSSVQSNRTSDAQPAGAPVKGPLQRVDGPHAMRHEELDRPAVETTGDSSESVQKPEVALPGSSWSLQAEQITAHLRQRRQELERREAQLQRLHAELEGELRNARLWLAERQQEFDGRETALAEREQAVAERASQIAAAESYHAQNEEASIRRLAAREEAIKIRESELDAVAARLRERQRLAASAKDELDAIRGRHQHELAVERQQIEVRRQASLELVRLAYVGLERRRIADQQRAERLLADAQRIAPRLAAKEAQQRTTSIELDRRWQAIGEAEALLAAGEADLAQARRAIYEERERHQRHAKAELRRLSELEKEIAAECTQQRQLLAEREARLLAREGTLDRFEAELASKHQSGLELRLEAEELWVRLAPAMAKDSRPGMLTELRQRLAEARRESELRQEQCRIELEAVAGKLAAEFEALSDRQQQFDDWASRRLHELDLRDEELSARQREVEQEAALQRSQSAEWDTERSDLQQQLRRLAIRLKRYEAGTDQAA